jgi:hypothetical protein
MPSRETPASEVHGLPRRRTRDALGLLTLLLVGLFFLNALRLPGGYRIYYAIVVANWVVLFAAAHGRWHAPRGRIWLLVALSPLSMAGVVLPLTLLSKRVRRAAGRDLAAAPGAVSPSSFPLGAPTVGKLILAVAISAAVFVGVFLFMGLWLGLSGANPSDTFAYWLIFAPPGVLSVLTLGYLVAGWFRARQSGHVAPEPD